MTIDISKIKEEFADRRKLAPIYATKDESTIAALLEAIDAMTEDRDRWKAQYIMLMIRYIHLEGEIKDKETAFVRLRDRVAVIEDGLARIGVKAHMEEVEK